MLGRNLSEGRAFIGIDARNPQTYSAGATLANGATLVEIGTDYVLLERNGVKARLYAQNVKSKTDAGSDLFVVGASPSFKPAKSTNTESYTEFLRPNPIYDSERFVGFEVYPSRASGVFGRLGLRAGDVIVELDGQSLVDPAAALAVLAQLSEGVSLTAVVRRGGKLERIALDGAIVVSESERARDAAAHPPPVASTVPTS